MRFVRLDKGDFIGREALRRGMTEPLRWQCVYLGIDASDADCLGSEAVFDGETRVGAISSGGYGHTVGRSLAFAYVAPSAATAGTPLAVMVQPGFHATLNNRADRFRAAMQAVLDEYQLPARIAGRASFWQPLFIDHEPRDAMDLLASDMPRARRLDHLWLKHGVFVLPGVRRFFSAAHDEADLARTLEALHAACAGVA